MKLKEIANVFKQRIIQNTMSSPSNACNLKKLMKIIYEKEKEVEKYRKMAREKEKNRMIPQEIHRDAMGQHTGFSEEEKNLLTQQVNENRDILKAAGKKIGEMELTIGQLQSDLIEEEQIVSSLTDELHECKLEISRKDQLIAELKTEIFLLQNHKTNSRDQITHQENQIENLSMENQKMKLVAEDLAEQKNSYASKLQKAEAEIGRYLIVLNRRSNKIGPKSSTNLLFMSKIEGQDKKIKTQVLLENIEESFQGKFKELLELFRNWEKCLIEKEQEWKDRFEASLCEEGSIDGISRLIKESFVLPQSPEDPILDGSQFKKNEEELLKQLQKECEQSFPNDSGDKEKLVQLSEVKESLKMTKQVNAQLFDELGKQEKIILMFKESFKNMQKKKLFKNEDEEEVKKLRSVFGLKN